MLGLYVVALMAGLGYAENWETSPKWGFQTTIGGDIEIVCNDTESMVMDNDMVEWMSPKDEKIMDDGKKYSLTMMNGIDGLSLKIMNVQEEDHGVYLCMVHRNGIFHMKVNRAVNLHEPSYKMLVDKYRYGIMVGGIAAAALFVPLVVICFVYKNRFRTAHDKEESRRAKEIRKHRHLHDIEAGALPVKTMPQNGAGSVNPGFDESTNL